MVVNPRELKYTKAKKSIDTQKAEKFIDKGGDSKDTPGRAKMEKVVSIKFSQDLLDRIDAEARASALTRASWIRMKLNQLLVERAKNRE